MLEPWLWNQQGSAKRLKKTLYWTAMAYPAFRKAATIHAVTPLERNHLRELLPDNRIEVIPNAVDGSRALTEATSEDLDDSLIVFLGRIEPKKGVDILLHAFATANLGTKWRVAIIGPFWSESYRRHLESIVETRGLKARIKFLGPLFGKEKDEYLQRAWVMVAPSHSEVIGLTNLEAGLYGTPSITTHETGLCDWEEGGGILTHPEVDSVRHALQIACNWTPNERKARGVASRKLVLTRYSWTVVLPSWLALYRSVLAT
jgi:glycosyltransferase involved in cell wall biosynthesis